MTLRISDRLIGLRVLSMLAMVWGVLLGFDLIQTFVNEIDEIGQGNYTTGTAILYTIYTIPRRAYELFPTAALIGSLLALGGLAATVLTEEDAG